MTRLSRTMLKRKVKGISPVVGPTYARARAGVDPVLGPLIQAVRHVRVRSEDSFIASYPRSGNTWLRFMLYEALTERTTEFQRVRRAMPHVNPYRRTEPLLRGGGRLYLTHEQYSRHYRNAKVVYLVRDVRDVVNSEYRRQQMNESYASDFDHFVSDFLGGRVHRFGSWKDHVTGWCAIAPKHASVLVVRYEDLKHDPAAALDDVLRFLGEPRSAAVIRRAVENNTLAAMRRKEDRARLPDARTGFRFVNEGASGSWHVRMTPDALERIERAAGPVLTRLGYQLETVSHG